MARNYFTGAANSGDVTNAANYSLGALTPASDILVFDRGSYDVYGDVSGLGAFQGVEITPDWKGRSFGTTAQPVKIRLASSTRFDIQGGPNLQLVHLGAGSNTTPLLVANGVPQLVLNTGTFTDVEMVGVGRFLVTSGTSAINLLAERSSGMLDVAGGATGPSLIVAGEGCNVRTRRAGASACASHIARGAVVQVDDPGSLGVEGSGALCMCYGTLIYRSGVAPPKIYAVSGLVTSDGTGVPVAYGTVRPWPSATFRDKSGGVPVTVSSTLPVGRR